ncbi:hypothetical protein GCM10007198_10930 [Microbacterium aerolatum]|uniref:Uncharacterized protein n=2 Tax=Microbacterium aerolatum TaxID=153731 RepID=A0A511AEC2_9MICO|nr:hypothetical protein MAE01_15420 [Microbacterium aerolatum]GGB22289.1 hypothetical protein GCM10007198_10930 [Microbacterium aerolatum]
MQFSRAGDGRERPGSVVDMEWIADPMDAGGWLRERLDDDWSMHHFVPHGFEAYARIFHPAEVRSLPDRAVPTMDEWVRMPDAEQQRLMEQFVDEPASWADAAAAFGTTVHALAQWQHLVRTPTDGDWRSRIAPDGREFSSPSEGEMSPELLAAIARHLVAHTSTPDAGYAALWEGRGGLLGFFGEGPSRGFYEFTDDLAHAQVLGQSFRDRFNNPFRKPKWQPGILSDEISKGPRLELPDRNHVLFAAAPAAFADPDWILDAPWRDREAEGHGFDPSAQHPSILWPADRAWVMVSEIDFDSTIVAGSNELIRAICADPPIEALPIREGSSLHWDADDINR